MQHAATADDSSFEPSAIPDYAEVKSSRVAPPPMVSPMTPEEVPAVNVANTEAMQPKGVPSAPAPGNLFTGFDTAVPKLDNVPLQVSDLGLILLNVGHI